MSPRDKMILKLAVPILIALIFIVWMIPMKTFAYEGGGETYNASSEESSSQQTRRDPPTGEYSEDEDEDEEKDTSPAKNAAANDMKETADEAVSGLQEYLGRASDMSKELFATESYDKLQETYKAPEIVDKAVGQVEKAQLISTDSILRIYRSAAGLILAHGLLAVSFGGYYEYFKDKKYNMLMRSVHVTRNKFGNGNNTTTTTTTTTPGAGGVTSTVTNAAKQATGPLGMYLYFFINSAIEIAAFILILIAIRLGFVTVLLNTVLQFAIKGLGYVFSFGK